MQQLVRDFAQALKWIDSSGKAFKHFRPGVGPYGEPQVLKKATNYLRENWPDRYEDARTKRYPDVLIPGRWALEFKIIRPYGDNGAPAENWSQNLLHPYEGNVSSLGDALKLLRSKLEEKKGIIVFAYEHRPAQVDLNVLIESFELLALKILKIPLGTRHTAELDDLVHPIHQQATVYGWELNSK